ncbi:MAG: hypothetical protein MJZ66_02795 [Bacteroidales bacterium]|nr:hypothetical protein [Bacteroidales bacterium]
MNWEIISIVLNFILGGGLLALVTIKAKKDQATAETDKVEMDNFRTGTRLLMESIVQPLREDLAATRGELAESRKELAESKAERARLNQTVSQLTNEVKQLRAAIEKINDCAHAGQCPVREELKKIV